ncbi:adenosine deaminase [Mucilaginibacter sp. HC2]|uniref:adenosine deaminase n=1 Tax=Mucilaginibacter inviolabilis TaxID=2714892 RepID=UPI00140B81F3|nr:adenosine deaminase [Mucilaginibacter inviolabilis]NHA03720.1 adenosine deaminase [Mucilaginibacter inviolabilis]
MKKYLTLIFLFFYFSVDAQSVNTYLDKIRNNPAKLTAFFSQMPKGGDLHHHYSGSVYAETFIKYVIEKDYFLNKQTLEVNNRKTSEDENWTKFSTLEKDGQLSEYKFRLLQKWSIKDYNQVSIPSDKQFFETFPNFSIASRNDVETGLLEIKKRAIDEHVSYIETTFFSPACGRTDDVSLQFDPKLQVVLKEKNVTHCQAILDTVYGELIKKDIISCADNFSANTITKTHSSLHIDDDLFTMRYQTYTVRTFEATEVFKRLLSAFDAASKNPLIVGVNILSPENNDIAMRDYWLHMQMFRYLHMKYPGVKYSMHAGELTLGLVKPEELNWHINAAVFDAGASRIGHGVDMPYETNSYALMNYMKKKGIAVEINLSSNEFILKVKEGRHPVTLYKEFQVPIVISSDDAGVLRTNLTEQYVLLANRYPEFTYQDIKEIVYNSIKYSFIKEPDIKQKLTAKLDKDFIQFEKLILVTSKMEH